MATPLSYFQFHGQSKYPRFIRQYKSDFSCQQLAHLCGDNLQDFYVDIFELLLLVDFI